jgi:hypothetical protein
MNKERELLERILNHMAGYDSAHYYIETRVEIRELLAQPEQPPMTQREMYQRGYAAGVRSFKEEHGITGETK